MERDSTFIDLSPILNDDQNNKKGLWQKLKCKCHIPIFVKDLLNLVVPAALIIGGVILIIFVIGSIV